MTEVKKSKQESNKSTAKRESKLTKEKSNGSDQKSNQTTSKTTVKGQEVANTQTPNEAKEKSAEQPSKKKQVNKQSPEDTVVNEGKPTAKAGKRSAKALKEEEEKQAKEARKALATEESAKPSLPKHKPRTAEDRLKSRGKKYQAAYKNIDRSKTYKLDEALSLAIATSPVKFDATVEMHIRLGVDPKQADQNIRGTLTLPAGTGKTVRIAVFAEGDDVQAARKAGADIAGDDDLLQQIEKGQLDFDVLISTPTMMARLGKYARVLGPKGLMPNPKSGTVAKDVAKAVQEAKAGRVEFRVDSTGIIHLGIGKVSFGTEKLVENARSILSSIKSAKPASLKGNYVLSIFASSTMGPSIQIDIAEATSA